MHILFFAFDLEEYSRGSSCSNAKEIWDKLEVTYECTDQVKKFKVEIFNLNYEAFKMKPEEDIKVAVALKSTTNKDSESSEKVDEDKEVAMFARRFKRFMKPSKERRLQKKKGLKLESTMEKDPIIYYECKK
ncbi:hypothetical protein PVK06_027481 [Gossypium arboreum]|uniref:Uncharacterized protein n=1 Tax=Gossypium arboreum TaxID=29729 RepID=A0ABR0P3S7_GOSAR|nr:hypothetical protein PVK06_027481 [Gossypium arboreum]